MTSKLTRDRIELIANFHRAMALPPSHAEIEELARMALAAMDSEPVIIVGDDGGDALSYRRLIQSFEPGTKLYRHAQPAPVVPDEIKHRIGGLDWGWEGEFNRGWNACRAAMLAAAPQEVKGE